MDDEGVLDPWVADWMADNPLFAAPFEDFSPEMLALARGPQGGPPTRDIAHMKDDVVAGVPIRIYQRDSAPTGMLVYFHGGGFVIGSIGLMDNVARELAFATGSVVISVGYRLAPEDPFPAALDDCEQVARWAFSSRERLGAPHGPFVVAGESAGGNLAAATALRLRDGGDAVLDGQILIYPAVAGGERFPSSAEFDGLILSRAATEAYWRAYSGGRQLSDESYAAPLRAPTLADLPPSLVILGGCDVLRDEGRAYAERLRDEGVTVRAKTFAGQPHGFINLDFPAAAEAFELLGEWWSGLAG